MYDNRVRKMMEIEAMIDSLKDEINGLKDEIVASMDASGLDEVRTDNFVIRNKVVVSNRFDGKAFKKDHEDMYNDYLKVSATVRFTHNEI
jgi:predicted phage-related endonuclease